MPCKSKVKVGTKTVHDLVLGELRELGDNVSKVVLSGFRCCRADEVNVAALSSPTYNASALRTCASYLGIKVLTKAGKNVHRNKGEVADRIVRKVKSFFSSTCGDCLESYYTRISTPPSLLTCHHCFRQSHDCTAMQEKFEPLLCLDIAGMVWLCQDCEQQTAADPVVVPKAKKDDSTDRESVAAKAEEPPTPAEAKDEKKVDCEIDGDVESDVDVIEEVAKPTEEKKPEEKDSLKGFQTLPPNKRTDTCPLYRSGSCPHGMSGSRLVNGAKCSKPHPHVCYTHRKFGTDPTRGCTKGKSCPYFHQTICKLSAKRQKCDRESCTLVHLRSAPKTKKAKAPTSQAAKKLMTANSARYKQKKDTKVTVLGEKDFQKALLSQQKEYRQEMKNLRDLITQMKTFPTPALYPQEWPSINAPPALAIPPTQAQQQFLRSLKPVWNPTLQTFVPSTC
jgi:hypothetical protein